MKGFFVLLEVLALGALGFKAYGDLTAPSMALVMREIPVVSFHVAPMIEPTSVAVQEPVEPSTVCAKLENVATADLSDVELSLTTLGLFQYARIQDRYLPGEYLVYFGPLQTRTAVKAFMKQFRQQGYVTATPILSGPLAEGIEIASFKTHEEALTLKNKIGSELSGVQVIEKNDLPSDRVDVVLDGLSQDQYMIFLSLSKKFPNNSISLCEIK